MRGIVLLVVMLAGAMAGSQVPAFVAAYQQRLGGAVDEALRQDDEYRRLAVAVGLDLDGLIRRLRASADPIVAGLGEVVAGTHARLTALEADAAALDRASPLARPFVLLRHHEPTMLRTTWARFRPGLALEPEFGAIGAVLGAVVMIALRAAARILRRPRRPALG